MKSTLAGLRGRRTFLKSAGGALATSFWASETLEAATQNVRTSSKPSDLKITDLRVAVVGRSPMRCPLIRLDTNQGVSGYGEVRDGASKTYALILKSRILGENPCNIDKIFRRIKQFGSHARQGGGVCGVEMALWDLAGKAYGVPVYQMLGGKFRDRIRVYADTTESHDPKVYGERMKKRIEQGFTWLKMDLGMDLVENIPGCVTRPAGVDLKTARNTQHMFTGMELTDKGIGLMADYVGKIREIVGMEIPLCADHFGHIGVNSCIRLGKAFEKCNLAWMEDVIPWYETDMLKKISDAVDVPICTGEDIYLKEGFQPLLEARGVSVIHPDVLTTGGILETKKIGDMAMDHGVAMAVHMAESPIGCMAAVHSVAATENFLALEYHSVDVPWWDDIANGLPKPLVKNGFIDLPDSPGLGIESLNDEVIAEHIHPNIPGLWESTDQWNDDWSHDRLWS